MAYQNLAKFYDRLNSDCNYVTWAEYIIALLKCRGVTSGRGLDIGCGSGKLTAQLSKSFQMTGLDISQEMLQNAYALGLKGVNFAIGDMRKFELAHKQDFICSSCDGVNYLKPNTEFDKFLAAAKHNLKPNGMLMFDVSSKYKLTQKLGNNIFADDTDDVTYIWQNDAQRDYIDMSFIIFVRQGDKYLKEYESHRMYLYTQDFIVQKLVDNGFKNIAVYDCFSNDSPKADSQRLQFIAQTEME